MLSRKTTISTALLSIIGGCVTGCAGLNAKPPIEEFANKLADQAIIPAVKQGLAQGVQQLTVQAGAQGINPTYVVNFAGKWVVGIEGRASVGVEGIAGQLQVSSAGGSPLTRRASHSDADRGAISELRSDRRVKGEKTEQSPYARGAAPPQPANREGLPPATAPSGAQP